MGLVEEGEYFGAFFEAGYFRSDGDDFSCSVLGTLAVLVVKIKFRHES